MITRHSTTLVANDRASGASRRSWRITLLALLGLLGLVAAACGSDSSTTDSSGASTETGSSTASSEAAGSGATTGSGAASSDCPTDFTPIKAGTLTAVAVSSVRRSRSMPEVPTVAESGFPGFEAGSWFGLFAAKGTPQPIIDKLNAQINAILREKDTAEHLEKQGAEPMGGSPQDFANMLKRDYEGWKPVVQRSGAAAD